MKIVVTGSLGHIGKPLTEDLVQKGHAVTVISSNPERTAAIEAIGAKAAIGTMEDAEFLTRTFIGADLVYTMLGGPSGAYMDPNFNLYGMVRKVMQNYKQAIIQSGVKRVIHLSSIGAHTDKNNGLLKIHFIAESTLKELPADVHLTFMRPTGFYYNLLAYIPMIKTTGVIATNYGGDNVTPWVAPVDIAAAIVKEIENPAATSPFIRYVASQELTSQETANILGEAIGKPDLKWVSISDQQMLDGLIAMGMTPAMAEGMVEMYGNRKTISEDYDLHHPVLGPTKMKDFAKEFAAAYHQQ